MDSQILLITGASKGIGRALGEYYAAAGHTVIGCSRNAPDTAPTFQLLTCDVTSEADVKDMLRQIRKEHGQLDAVINNAGAASMNHSLLTPGDTFQRLMEINTLGTFLVSREAAKLMRKAKVGRIVNFSTVAVSLSLEGECAYVAAKSGVEALTRVMSKELADLNVTVNCVGPTPIETDLIRNVPKDKLEALVERQAIKRMGRFEDVINVVDFFLRPESDFVTGQTVYLGGV